MEKDEGSFHPYVMKLPQDEKTFTQMRVVKGVTKIGSYSQKG